MELGFVFVLSSVFAAEVIESDFIAVKNGEELLCLLVSASAILNHGEQRRNEVLPLHKWTFCVLHVQHLRVLVHLKSVILSKNFNVAYDNIT